MNRFIGSLHYDPDRPMPTAKPDLRLGYDPILRIEGVRGEDPEASLAGYWGMVNLGVGVEL